MNHADLMKQLADLHDMVVLNKTTKLVIDHIKNAAYYGAYSITIGDEPENNIVTTEFLEAMGYTVIRKPTITTHERSYRPLVISWK